MHHTGGWCRRLRSSTTSLELGLLLALILLPVLSRDLGAAPGAPADGAVLSLAPPDDHFLGPGSGVELVWATTNHTDAAIRFTLEFTASRSWPRLVRTGPPMEVPPNSTTRFGIAASVPDTAAAGQVSIFVRVHRVDDATTLDSCASSLYVQSAPNAGVPVVIVPDLVRLEWSTRMRPSALGIVELQRDGEGWHPEGGIYADDDGRCAFEDRNVTPGSTVEYRMRAMYNGLAMVSAVTTVHVPELTPLAIAGLRPNPSRASPVIAFTLPQRAATRLDVYDVAGRRVWASDLGVLAPGPHVQTLEPNGALRSGVYVFRLTCGARSVSVSGVIAR